MSNNWKKKPLGSLCNGIGDGVHGTPKYVVDSPYCFINGNNLKDGKIDTSSAKRVDGDEYERHFIELDETTLLMSINGTLGSLALYRGESVILGKSAAYIRCRDISREFCYYYFQLRETQRVFFNIATGSTIKNLSLDSIKNFHVPVPSVNEQKAISSVLSALDAKIELNNRINAELEGMAKLLYDYWFVQHDFPISAAQAAALGKPHLTGKPYRSSGFPMTYKPQLKREIPLEWEVKKLCEVESNIITGKTPPTSDTENFSGDVPFICIGDVRGNMHVIKTELTLSSKGASLQKNKFIPKGAICVTCIASPGLIGFATRDSQTNQQLNSIICDNEEHKEFLYFYLKNHFTNSSGAKMGNTFANMNKADFSAIPVLLPESETIKFFSETVRPLFDSILNNSQQNQELAQLSDWLLPMLMNGQVRVSNS
jgi:type I restriction enzyme, S subunit